MGENEKALMDGVYMAWTIIANAGEGSWEGTQTPEWRAAA